jgi:hypothetical protein
MSIPQKRHRSKYAKDDLRYWQDVIYKPRAGHKGNMRESHFYVVHLARNGKRTTFPLETSNKAAAALKAREIYRVLITNGWETALGRFKKTPNPISQSSAAPSFNQLKRDFLALIVPSTTRECWSWAGEHAPRNGRPIFRGEWAYRVAYTIYKGPIPVGWEVHHKCENSKCVNPQHLETSQPEEHRRKHRPSPSDD